ncbi:MAG: 50S ribosomal protein L25 [Acidobacteriota bacterium]
MSDASILVNRRETQGKNANRRLRAGGQIPAVVYGGDRDPVNIQVGQRDFEALLRKTADDNPIFLLELDGTGQKRHAMIREMHADTVTNQVLHIDFLRVNMEQELQTSVRLELTGESPGVKLGGLLDWVTRDLEIWAMPDRIPGHIDVDVSSLEIGDHLDTTELSLPEGVRLADENSRTVVSVHGKQGGDEDEDGEEEAEADA